MTPEFASRHRFLSLGGGALGFYGQAGVLPGLETAFKSIDVLVTTAEKLLRQTGAGSLVGSSAIGNNRPAFRDLGKVFLPFVHGNADRFGDLVVGLRPRLRIADINDGEIFSRFHSFSQFVDGDSWGFRHTQSLSG